MGRLVPAVTRALDILELFLDGDGTLSAPDIVRRLQLPRTTVHELVTTLAARKYIVPVAGQPGRYRLGVRPYQLGARYAEHLDLAAEGQQVARSVAETCDETVHVAILEDTDVIYIAKVDSTHAVRMVSAAAASPRTAPPSARCCWPPSRAGTGRAFPRRRGADRDDPEQHHRPGRPARDPRRDPHAGVAVESRESNPDVSCVAAPVRDRTGQVVAALSISVPMIRWSDERLAELEQLAVKGAADLSERLGHRSMA